MPGEHEGHRQRLRSRYRSEGLDGFEPHQVLELMLFYSNPRADTNPIAHRLLERFGSLDAVLDASVEELLEVKGVGENTAVMLNLVPQIARRYLEAKNATDNLVGGLSDLGKYLLPRFVGRKNELLLIVSIDNKGRILSCDRLAEGEIGRVNVTKRTVIETVLRTKASRAVLAHNHPQGYAVPSQEDIDLTLQLRKSLREVGVELVDHIIVANDDYVSMAASGYFLGT
ncbi:MAG TPA: DNA repair protein RadC [Oscillospiraceae bacterium]|nr:DNA repair protein RadC [Oscillospiraceae bacterium]HRW56473.1 DNA repair protein RadC [Oscillospiraceae bacterium]